MKRSLIRELRRAVHRATTLATGTVRNSQVEPTDREARAARVGLLLDEASYRRLYGMRLGGLSPVMHYLRHSTVQHLNPHPLFEDAFYKAQLSGALPPDLTPLEHYLDHGAAAGLDPSPLFDAKAYCDLHPDVAKANVNPLVHYIRWGAREGRKLPTRWPDLEGRLEQTLSRDPLHPVALQILSQLRLDQGRVTDALDAITSLDTVQEPSAGSLLLRGRIEQRLGRFAAAVECYEKVRELAPIHAAPEFVSLVLVEEARTLEKEGNYTAAIESLNLAVERGHPTAKKILRQAAKLQFASGQRGASLEALHALADSSRVYQDVQLIGAKQYSRAGNSSYLELLPARSIAPVEIRFLDPGQALTSEPGRLEASPVYLSSVEEVVAISRCNIVLKHGFGIYDAAAHPLGSRAILGDSYHDRPLILARSGNHALVEQPRETHQLGSGQMMFGVGTANYGHWFLEFLPRMLVFDGQQTPIDVPIFVDPGMPPTHLEALRLLNSQHRPIRTMPTDGKVVFERLYMAPVPAFFPLEMSGGPNYDTVWPRDVFGELRLRILQRLTLRNPRSGNGKRLFIRRGSYGLRKLVNEDEILSFLSGHGFESIQPETLTFAEQAAVFQSADVVIGSCSSALTNAIFCEPGARVVGLIHDQLDFNFRGYASFITTGGADILFVQGQSLPDPKVHHFHYAYEISLDQIRRSLDWALAG